LRPLIVPTLFATSGVRDANGDIILKIVNPLPEQKTCKVELRGVSSIRPDGEVIVLTSASLDDENSFEHPDRIAPRSSKLGGLGDSFEYSCPSNSVSILKIERNR
jgi:alpha-L-arabinofuranosidase